MATEPAQRDAWIVYTNWKGETERRHVSPILFFFGLSQWHDGYQWFMSALDIDRDAPRTFALSGIRAWSRVPEGLPDDP
jgi:predicted DNA-binding transcriptional regulator YafY